jgi:hypothetical protein
MPAHRIVIALGVAALVGGCHDRSSGGDPLARSVAGVDAATGASASGAPTSPGNARVVDLLTKALACGWGDDGPALECDAARAWREARDVFEGGREDAPLVDVLARSDDRARYLAAQNLAVFGERYRTDKALATRVVLAAEREKSVRVAESLGEAVAKVDVDATDLFDRVRAMAMNHDLLPLRSALAASLAEHNPASGPSFTLTLDLLRDRDEEVRVAAIGALWMCENRHPVEACGAWREHIDDADDDDLASRACDYLSWSGHCQDAIDALLDSEERRFKAGKTSEALFAKALANICEDVKTTRTQKERATDLVRSMAQQASTPRPARGGALAAVLRCDTANGRAFVARFANDSDPFIQARTRDLLRPP